jgi:hypothetical protein
VHPIIVTGIGELPQRLKRPNHPKQLDPQSIVKRGEAGSLCGARFLAPLALKVYSDL